jgi:hypothetical protein
LLEICDVTSFSRSGCVHSHVRVKSADLQQFKPGDFYGKSMDEKNPFMSMWLSGANAAVRRARVHATAQGRAVLTKQVTQFWTGTWLAARTQAAPVRILQAGGRRYG